MKPGDKVVCVDDGPCRICGKGRYPGLTKGTVYVIVSVKQFSVKEGHGVCIKVIGIREPGCCFPGYFEDHTSIDRFRKLDELKAEAGDRQKAKLVKRIDALLERLGRD